MPETKKSKEILETYAKIYDKSKKAEAEFKAMTPEQQAAPGGVALNDYIKGFDQNILAQGAEYAEQQRLAKLIKEQRIERQEGGALLVPPEQEAIPTDTYTPNEQENAEANQLPDTKMEEEYLDFILDVALDDEEEDYLMSALEADQLLDDIFDMVVETASEFSGEGEVKGPGTGVSDSIPARLSDGEFVITKKATDQIGANNLQSIMDEAERAYDGGLQKYALGGTAEDDEDEKSLLGKKDEEEIKKQMITANRMPSVI